MKTILLCISFLLSGMLTAQTIDHPTFKARTGSIDNITRIERTPENTRLYIHAIFRPHWWIQEDGDCYLEDAATGKKYQFKSAEGIELKKQTYMPESGEMNFVLVFEPLPKETQTIHLLSPTDSEGNTYDISLVAPKKKKESPLNAIKGNWYKADILNQWEYGIYDSISIIQNRIFSNESIRKKGKSIEVIAKCNQGNLTANLLFTPQKDGKYLIKINGVNEYPYTKQNNASRAIFAENDFKDFFRPDSTCLQGYIDGYDRRLGFETGLIYLENVLTREDYPTVVKIAPDGSFTCKFKINHPMESALVLGNNWLPFYIEPGQTLTMYLDWEDMLARSRARDYYFPIKNTAYMGPSASLSYLLKDFGNLIEYRYDDLSKSQKSMTPNQYKEHMKPIFAKWKHVADSVCLRKSSHKATHLINNKVNLQIGSALLNFLMSRDYYAQQDTTNQALKVKEDDTYYDFLKYMPLNDETWLADTQFKSFINRFEYMNILDKVYNRTPVNSNVITVFYPKKSILTFLKEKGIKLNAEQEKLRLKQEKLAGTKVATTDTIEFKKELEITKKLYQKEEKLLKEYSEKYSRKSGQSEVKTEEDLMEEDNGFISSEQNYAQKKDSIIAQICNVPKPLLWEVARVRRLNYQLGNIKSDKLARAFTDSIKQILTRPYLVAEAERMLEKTHPEDKSKTYQLPEGIATDIFRNITKNHPGKVLFVDFWGTFCGPCRAGIEATADLRKKYKDHPEFQFIYITGKKDSPEANYKQYVEKHLKGEASYHLSETEFNYLRQLFQFNGIPHYELVEKDGSILKEELSTYNIAYYLQQRFKSPVEQQNAE